MKIPGIKLIDPDILRNWLDSREHSWECTSHSEGQKCCLDKFLESNDDSLGVLS